MTSITTTPNFSQPVVEMAVDLSTPGSIRSRPRVRTLAREFIEEMIRCELDTALARPRVTVEARWPAMKEEQGSLRPPGRLRSIAGAVGQDFDAHNTESINHLVRLMTHNDGKKVIKFYNPRSRGID